MFNCYLKKYNDVTKKCVHFFFLLGGSTVPEALCTVHVLKLRNGAQFVMKCTRLQMVWLC
jgi:hypothetical protein